MNLAGITPLIILVVVIGYVLTSGRGAPTSSDDLDEEELRRRDSSNWIGPFYRNAEDPNLFVPKRSGIGTTVNVARPLGVVIVAVPIVLAIVLLVFNHG